MGKAGATGHRIVWFSAQARSASVTFHTGGWGDAVQASKAGLIEIADVFVINKADRKGVEDTRRDLEQMLELGDMPHEAWRPPIIPVVATEKKGVDQLWATVVEHRAFIEGNGDGARVVPR